MKLVSFSHRGEGGIGVLDDSRSVVEPIVTPQGVRLRPHEMTEVLVATMPATHDGGPRTEAAIPLAEVNLLAPLAYPPRNVFCVGRNYVEHSDEFSRSGFDASGAASGAPDAPIVFTKPRTCIIGPGGAIDPHTGLTDALDYEAELAVIIGRRGSAITQAEAWDYVWGMTLVNDITARDLQQRHKQWFLGKCLDTFLPMGPAAVSLDELQGEEIVLEGRVNGELRQSASVKDMIFDIPTIIETITAGMTLEPGDVIATGTPAGVGIGFDPPRFLQPGDEVEVSATGLGTLRNTVAVATGAK